MFYGMFDVFSNQNSRIIIIILCSFAAKLRKIGEKTAKIMANSDLLADLNDIY